MKGKSRRKKKTDWNAVAVQVLASVISGCKYNIFFRVSKDEEFGYYCDRSFGRLPRKKDL